MSGRTGEHDPLLGYSNTPSPDAENVHEVTKPVPIEVEGLRLYLALTFPLIGLLFVALDVTMVSTVSATVAADFSSLAVVSWLGSAYLVAVAAVQPISGKFWALLFFGVGNLMCGLAPNESTLIAGRVVAGCGGGAISSIGVFIISDLLPLRKRPVWQGLGNVFWAMGMGIGGVVGGVVNDAWGWRSNFMLLTPCTVFVAIGCYFTLVPGLPRPTTDSNHGKPSKGIDVLGSSLLTAALVCFVLGLNFQEDGKNRLLSLLLLVIAAVSFACFLVAELWFVADPVVPLHLLANRSVTGACLAGFFISISMHSLLFYVPLLIQVRGFNTSETGLQLLGNPLGSAIAPLCTGLALRVLGGYTVVKPIVFIMYLAGPIGFYFSTLATPPWATVVYMALLGAGFGSVLTFNLTGLLANINDHFQATGTGMQYAFRQIGASGGLAISGIIFRLKVEKELARTIAEMSGFLGELAVPENISKQCRRSNYVGNEPPTACLVYFDALHDVFLFTLVTGIAGFVFGMIIKNKSLDRGKDRQVDD